MVNKKVSDEILNEHVIYCSTILEVFQNYSPHNGI